MGDLGGIRVSDSFFGASKEDIEKDYQERCEEISKEIKRHVENVQGCGIEFDSEEVCEFCGHEWDVSLDDSDPDYPKGCPLCCQKAIDEWKVNNKQ